MRLLFSLLLITTLITDCADKKLAYTSARDALVFGAEQHVMLEYSKRGIESASKTLDDWTQVFSAIQSARLEPGADKLEPIKETIKRLTHDLEKVNDPKARFALDLLVKAAGSGAGFFNFEFRLDHENNYPTWKQTIRDRLRKLEDKKGSDS